MDPDTKQIIGYTGGTLLNITFLPQIYRTFKTKQTDDISLVFMILQVITSILYVVYSFLLDEQPLIVSNLILLCELLTLLVGKIMFSYVYKKKDELNLQNNRMVLRRTTLV
jgi:MtN3 and saliva related transmembrane protein